MFLNNRKDAKSYYKPLLKLVEKYPDSPFLLARLAVGHLFLDDIIGALELFEEAHTLLDDHDAKLEKYLEVLRKFVKRNEEEEDREWSEPEGSFIVSFHVPPEPISSYSFGAVSDENVKKAWSALLSEDKKDFVAERYARLLAVESNEIEHVFHLGGESLVRLVRAGFYTAAIDRVLDSPSGRPDPLQVVNILKDFSQALDTFIDILKTCPEVAAEHICRLHALLLESNIISTVFIDNDKVDYLVPPGVYRRRLITTTLEGIDGVVQFTKWKDIPKEMVSFMSHMKDCLLSTASPFVKAAWIHSVFARIHPFADGNGRVARIIASIPLIKAGLPFINIRQKLREDYLQAVFTAQSKKDLQPLAEIFVKSMEDSIQYIGTLSPPSPDDRQWAQSYTSGSTRIYIK